MEFFLGRDVSAFSWLRDKGKVQSSSPETCSIEHRSGSSISQYWFVPALQIGAWSPSCPPEAGRSTGAATGAQDWAKALPVPYSDLANPSSPIRLFSEGWDRPHSDETTLRDNPFPIQGNLSSPDAPLIPADIPRNVFIQLILSQGYHLSGIIVRALSKATAVFVKSLSLHKLKDYSLNLKRAESLRW